MTTWMVLPLLLTSAAILAETRPKVFVHADPRALATGNPETRRGLQDSVSDLREQLRKRPELALAKDRGEADILVTVLDRRLEVNRSGETRYFGYTQTHFQSRYVLAFRIEAGRLDYETEAALAGAFVTWKRVAGVVAKDVEIWVREHREQMLGER